MVGGKGCGGSRFARTSHTMASPPFTATLICRQLHAGTTTAPSLLRRSTGGLHNWKPKVPGALSAVLRYTVRGDPCPGPVPVAGFYRPIVPCRSGQDRRPASHVLLVARYAHGLTVTIQRGPTGMARCLRSDCDLRYPPLLPAPATGLHIVAVWESAST